MNVQAPGHTHDCRGAVTPALITRISLLGPGIGNSTGLGVERQHGVNALGRHEHPQIPLLCDDGNPVAREVFRGRCARASRRLCRAFLSLRTACGGWLPGLGLVCQNTHKRKCYQARPRRISVHNLRFTFHVASERQSKLLAGLPLPLPSVARPFDARNEHSMRGGIASKLTVNNDMVARLKRCSGDLRVGQQARGAPLESPALRRSLFSHDLYLYERMWIASSKLR